MERGIEVVRVVKLRSAGMLDLQTLLIRLLLSFEKLGKSQLKLLF